MSDIWAKIRSLETCDRSYEEHELRLYREVRDLTTKLVDSTNTMGSSGVVEAGIVAGIINCHRYLQEQGIKALVYALGEFGRLPTGQFTDARNQFAHKLCGILREKLRDEMFWKDPTAKH